MVRFVSCPMSKWACTWMFGVAMFASACTEDPTGALGDGGGTVVRDSGVGGGGGTDGGPGPLEDGGPGSNDGAVTGDGAVGDGATEDSGSPLEVPLSDFCTGEGSVVVVGANGECAGDIAQDAFQFAVCTCETLRVQSNFTVDAFDSRLGGYNASLPGGVSNISDDGHIGVNGALATSTTSGGGMVNVRGSVFVGGGGFSVGPSSLITRNIYARGDARQENSSSEIGRNAWIDGDVIGRYRIVGDLYVPQGATVSSQTANAVGGRIIRGAIPPVATCPCQPNQILDIAALTAWAATHNDNAVESVVTSTTWQDRQGPNDITLPCGRYYLTRIDHDGRLVIRAQGRTVLFIDGDLRVGGGLTIAIDDGAEVDIFVAGQLSVGASAVFGDPARPSRVRTYVGGTGTISLQASAVFGGNLYAPRSNVVFGAGARLFGSLFARNVSFSGSAAVHFDTAIRSASDDCVDGGVDGGVNDGGPGGDGGPGDGGPGDGGPRPDGMPGDVGPAPDAGPGGCTDCSECGGTLGCVEGMCLPCENDLNCCAPLFCVNGMCTISF